jgi:hypothetical protein
MSCNDHVTPLLKIQSLRKICVISRTLWIFERKCMLVGNECSDWLTMEGFFLIEGTITCSDWSKVCNMSVYIRGQRFSAHACIFHRFKIFYKSNIKRSLVSIYCDINTLEVVEHLRSQRNTCLCIVFLLNFSSALQLPSCLYYSI